MPGERPRCRRRRHPPGSAGSASSGPASSCSALSIGSGEFLLGPAVFVTARAVAALGDGGRGLPPDHLQHRSDALHAGDRRAGVHGLHAHAAVVDRSGRGSTSPCTSCRSAGRRWPPPRPARSSFCSRGGSPGPTDADVDLLHRRRHFPGVRGAARRAAHRAHARDRSTGCWSSCILERLSGPGAALRARRTWLGGGRRARRVRSAHAAVRLPLPAGTDFFLLGALVAYSGAGGVTNITLSNWARDKGYGMGEARRLHPRRDRRREGAPRAHRLHLRARRRGDAPMARVVADRPRRSVGRVLRPARSSAWCCRRCCT